MEGKYRTFYTIFNVFLYSVGNGVANKASANYSDDLFIYKKLFNKNI